MDSNELNNAHVIRTDPEAAFVKLENVHQILGSFAKVLTINWTFRFVAHELKRFHTAKSFHF